MAVKKKVGAKKGSKKTTKMTASALAKAADRFDTLPEGLACRGCVEQAVRSVCGPFNSISQTLDDICSPCNTGKLNALEKAVATCGSGGRPNLDCTMTVRDVIDEVCR